ncbi:sporulation integral membrane protein YlbJ [Virgibacillus halophilus]|uniref:Sporulation integral membrane protein YlbJ n=1 Tax=Tigheibacillus halophilus TaxID=361280 RepID=A0ABU5CBQ4_9BACI|nr:sporulation integral membrane protein YlbJ [Virgibacillus halophilus]
MKSKLKTIVLAIAVIALALVMIKFPKDAYEASIRGLDMWWEIVFPSLLPFFITAELLLSFGVVRLLGVLFEPIMRPIFRVPGAGSFAWILGMVSGYPTGAKITARLRQEKQLTRIEAERLTSFTNASSPLFIVAALSVGFLGDARLGLLIAVCHYTGNVFVGIIMRFYGVRQEEKQAKMKLKQQNGLVLHALKEMHRTRIKDKRAFGEILGDAVLNSVQTLLMVGGFIILFSVLSKLLFLVQFTPVLAAGLHFIFQMLQLPVELALPFISGVLEITVGASMISKESIDPLFAVIVVISFILGFNGLSIHAQVASIISETDIRYFPYFIGRILHAFIASILTVLLYRPLYLDRQAFDGNDLAVGAPAAENTWSSALGYVQDIGPIISLVFIFLSTIILFHRLKKTAF